MKNKRLGSVARTFSAIYQYPESPPRSLALISLLGMPQAEVDQIVSAGAAKLSRRFERTVYLTTADDFTVFRQRSLIVEYFPEALWGDSLTWRHYLLRRQEIILAKWQPDWILSYGKTFEKYLDEVCESVSLG